MIDWGKLQRVSLQLLFLISVPVSIAVTIHYNLWLWFIFGFLYSKIAITMISIQIGLHRYFAHGQFRTGKLRHIFLCCMSIIGGEGDPLSWSKAHIHHHRYSDQPKDVHSPTVDGWLHSCLGFIFKPTSWFVEKNIRITTSSVVRLTKDPLVMFIHKNYLYIWYMLIAVSFLISWEVCLFFVLMPTGIAILNTSILSATLLHMKLSSSYRNYDTPDNSHNNRWILAWNLGEGLHNNHHKFPFDYDTAKKPGEFDLTAWIIKKWFKIN